MHPRHFNYKTLLAILLVAVMLAGFGIAGRRPAQHQTSGPAADTTTTSAPPATAPSQAGAPDAGKGRVNCGAKPDVPVKENWQRYDNPVQCFSLAYPLGWNFEPQKQPGADSVSLLVLTRPGTSYADNKPGSVHVRQGAYISVTPPLSLNGKSLAELAADTKAADETIKSQAGSLAHGRPALQVVYSTKDSGDEWLAMFVQTDSSHYMLARLAAEKDEASGLFYADFSGVAASYRTYFKQ